MAKRSIIARALGLAKPEDDPAAEPSEIAAIFDAIRSGDVPWDADELPEDARRATKLLFELDRIWLRPHA